MEPATLDRLHRPGVSRKVSADMFGLALRDYLRKLQRLEEGHRARPLAVGGRAALPADPQPGGGAAALHRDDPELVRGVLHDRCDRQVTHRLALGHADSFSNGAIMEDSEAEVQLVSGGERCRSLQEHVGVIARDSLEAAINDALDGWGASVSDTLDCTPCGRPGCELACRFR